LSAPARWRAVRRARVELSAVQRCQFGNRSSARRRGVWPWLGTRLLGGDQYFVVVACSRLLWRGAPTPRASRRNRSFRQRRLASSDAPAALAGVQLHTRQPAPIRCESESSSIRSFAGAFVPMQHSAAPSGALRAFGRTPRFRAHSARRLLAATRLWRATSALLCFAVCCREP